MGEKCKVSIRNIRRPNDELKKLLKSDISEDDEKKYEKLFRNIQQQNQNYR